MAETRAERRAAASHRATGAVPFDDIRSERMGILLIVGLLCRGLPFERPVVETVVHHRRLRGVEFLHRMHGYAFLIGSRDGAGRPVGENTAKRTTISPPSTPARSTAAARPSGMAASGFGWRSGKRPQGRDHVQPGEHGEGRAIAGR